MSFGAKARYLFGFFTLIASLLSSIDSAYAISSNPTESCVSGICTSTFTYTGDYYQWTVPSGVSSVTVDAYGAQGGKSSCTSNTLASGGLGGRVQATLSVTSGSILYFYVGGQGSTASMSGTSTSPGWNGGGRGGVGNGGGYWGSGGGGATDVRTSAGVLSSRLIVAGGGGGASCQNASTTDNGGAGGGLIGGESANTASLSTKAPGGTQSAGGAATTWSGWGPSQSGSLGIGGNAQATDVTTGGSYINGGGGGGGGYYGGGGGSWVGGGGGSSFTDSGLATSVTHTQGNRTGNGNLVISYQAAPLSLALSVAGNVSSVIKGQAIILTATANYVGKVTFYANGKKIAGCISLPITTGSKICSWKPTLHSAVPIYVLFTPNGGGATSTSTKISLSAGKRTTTR